jgi:predicted PurR-regulated permease PerM
VAFGFIGVFLGPTLLAVGYSLAHEILTNRSSALAPEPVCEPQKSSAQKDVGADEKN